MYIKRAFRKRFPSYEATTSINIIQNVTLKAEVIRIIDKVVEKWLETEKWFQNKRVDQILARITLEVSKIPIDQWINAPHYTGISESSHFHDNEAVGRKQALLTAILRYITLFIIYRVYY